MITGFNNVAWEASTETVDDWRAGAAGVDDQLHFLVLGG
jgi:hypothetical protein